jgi:hypothetical protein
MCLKQEMHCNQIKLPAVGRSAVVKCTQTSVTTGAHDHDILQQARCCTLVPPSYPTQLLISTAATPAALLTCHEASMAKALMLHSSQSRKCWLLPRSLLQAPHHASQGKHTITDDHSMLQALQCKHNKL